ncbi:DHA2 family efflux MFS transporter permease subunit [Dactylosporangium aurantiacum]|uniref:DHA2 family efflux MFS transporter permease subunit n=1 Tax=Dactylosporangium aurantiacum TaxID=35754 RepID=A0A9Q9IMM1_9ACTN|nr:DHA2 family efflux MFS transporter permease subunit [Dactylosporangium aurantiacum]MDG6109115.1 DHA2 family efflux MFS transporter permease subunit [Dactylosporangium aurantiacum]UWZ58446.1 DHA2 family efflux MFS transporter permease subunit [Dactylosporangium aurantiacum]
MSIVDDAARVDPGAAPAAPDGRRWWALLVISFAQFMIVIDATVVNVMLPQLRADLGLTATGMQWVMSSYVLLFGGLLLLGGRLTDILGRRRVFIGGLALFTAGSALAGLAGGEATLLAARAVQGIGGAAIAPATLSILVTTFAEGKERNKAFGIWGTVIGVGASIGTLLGGAVVDIGWRWAFYINIPVGVLLVLGALLLVSGARPTGPRPPADTAGALTATGGMLLVVYAIVSVTTNGWTDPVTLAAAAGGLALLGVFLRIERSTAAPLLPLRLFRQRGVVAGSLGEFLTAGIMLPSFFLLPLYMQTVLGYSPLETGLAYIPTSLALMIVAPVLLQLIGRTGPRALYLIGTVLLGAMLVLMLDTPLRANYWTVLLPVTTLLGAGLVFCLVPTPVVGTSQATGDDAGATSAVLNTATQVGAAFGLAVVATVVQDRVATLVARGVDPIEALNAALHRGFAVLGVWVVLSFAVGLVGFRGLRGASGQAADAPAEARPAAAD